MKKRRNLISFVVVLLIILSSGCSEGDKVLMTSDEKHSINLGEVMGTWKVYDHKFVGITGMSKEEAKGYIGSIIELEPNKAESFVGSCEGVDYSYSFKDSLGMYLYETRRIEPKQIDIKAKKGHVIEFNCNNQFHTNMVYLKSNNEIIIWWDGVTFFARKDPWYSWIYF